MSIIPHLPGLLSLAAGTGATWLGYRPAASRTARSLRFAGPAVIAFAAFFLLSKGGFQPRWERFAIDGGRASAEFPGAPSEQAVTDTAGPVSTARRSLIFDVPGRELSLRLSISPLPFEATTTTDAERVDLTVAYFARQGFILRSREEIASPAATIHRLELRWEAKKMTTHVLLGYARGKVYRAMSTTGDGDPAHGIGQRFLASFRIEPKAPAERRPGSGGSPRGGAVAAFEMKRPPLAWLAR